MSNGDIEEQKLALERDRFELEKTRQIRELRQQKWTRVGLVVPLLVAVVAGSVSLWSSGQQRIEERKQAAAEAQATFELKASELVMDGETPLAVRNRACSLAQLFPNRLDGFAEGLDLSQLVSSGSGIVEAKKEFLALVIEHPQRRAVTAQTWRRLFPDDPWIYQFVGRDIPTDLGPRSSTAIPPGCKAAGTP